jgi:hypothetical protein
MLLTLYFSLASLRNTLQDGRLTLWNAYQPGNGYLPGRSLDYGGTAYLVRRVRGFRGMDQGVILHCEMV